MSMRWRVGFVPRGGVRAGVVAVIGLVGCRPAGGEPARPPAAPVSEPVVGCEAAARLAASVSRAGSERWVRVENGASIQVGSARVRSQQRAIEAPAAAVLLGEHAGCMQLAWRDGSVELYLAVAEDDLAPVITTRTRVDAEGEVAGSEQDAGLWLAPGAPVTIDLDAERPRVRLSVRGMDAGGTVAPEVVGTTFQREPFVAGPEERKALTFDHALPLFASPDRGAFAVVNMNAGVMELADGELQLPMSYIATFTVEEVGRRGEWVEVIVRGGDGSYELRGLTPAFAVRPPTPYYLASPYAGTVELPAGTELRDPQGVLVGRTSADGLYSLGDEPGEIVLGTPWANIEVRTAVVSKQP